MCLLPDYPGRTYGVATTIPPHPALRSFDQVILPPALNFDLKPANKSYYILRLCETILRCVLRSVASLPNALR